MTSPGRFAQGAPRSRRARAEVQALDPELVLSSPSARTRETVECLDLSAPVDFLEPLYSADADELLEAVREVSARDDPPDTVLLVGHNPGVHQLVLELTDGEQLPGFPPSALAVLALDCRLLVGGGTRRGAADRRCTCRRARTSSTRVARRSVACVGWPDPSGGLTCRALPAPFLVVGAVVSVQIGGALAKHVIDDVGPAAATSLRLVFAAVVLLALWRPRPAALRTWA